MNEYLGERPLKRVGYFLAKCCFRQEKCLKGRKVFQGPKVGNDHIFAHKGNFLELPGKPKVVKKSARNSPIRKEPNSLNPPGKVAKKP